MRESRTKSGLWLSGNAVPENGHKEKCLCVRERNLKKGKGVFFKRKGVYLLSAPMILTASATGEWQICCLPSAPQQCTLSRQTGSKPPELLHELGEVCSNLWVMGLHNPWSGMNPHFPSSCSSLVDSYWDLPRPGKISIEMSTLQPVSRRHYITYQTKSASPTPSIFN